MQAKDAVGWFVFVDFENVPKVDLELVEGQPAHVTLLIGKNQRKLELALVRQIHRLARQVELVEVGASGRNALDLTLAYYLGQAVLRAPTAQFCIVSGDRDFDPMINHLQGIRIKVERYDDFVRLPFLPAPKLAAPVKPAAVAKPAGVARPGVPARRAPLDRRAKVIAKLKDPANRNRPATEKALLAHIKHALGKEATATGVDDIFRELSEGHHLTIGPRGRVNYGAVKTSQNPETPTDRGNGVAARRGGLSATRLWNQVTRSLRGQRGPT